MIRRRVKISNEKSQRDGNEFPPAFHYFPMNSPRISQSGFRAGRVSTISFKWKRVLVKENDEFCVSEFCF